MHALIIGGSGRTGKLVIEQLLQRGKSKALKQLVCFHS
jgi:uncharacterized protein YbjT (DUF2867 family)